MHQQLWGYKVKEKIYLGVRKRKMLNITALYISLRMGAPNSHRSRRSCVCPLGFNGC